MKVFKILLISCFMLVTAQSFAFAGSGKAIVPHWKVTSQMGITVGQVIFISNISNHDLIVKLSVYKHDSTIETAGLQYANFINNNTEIGAGETAHISIQTNTEDEGYAVIEWKNKDGEDDTVGLVASKVNFPINNGMPF